MDIAQTQKAVQYVSGQIHTPKDVLTLLKIICGVFHIRLTHSIQRTLSDLESLLILVLSLLILVVLGILMPTLETKFGTSPKVDSIPVIYQFFDLDGALLKRAMRPSYFFSSQTPTRDSDDLLNSLMKHEGYVRHIYYDGTGKCSKKGCMTLGYGHCIHKPHCGFGLEIAEAVLMKPIGLKTVISKAEALRLLRYDLEQARKQAYQHLDFMRNLSISQKNAVIEMTFNSGVFTVKKLKRMIKALKSGDGAKAARAFAGTLFCRQVGQRCSYYQSKLRR